MSYWKKRKLQSHFERGREGIAECALNELSTFLTQLDGCGYKRYQELRGKFTLSDEEHPPFLFIDHVQADPFAPPSKMRVRVPLERIMIPHDLYSNRLRCIALSDFLAREIHAGLKKLLSDDRSVYIDVGGQTVLQRSAVVVRPEHGYVEARIGVHLPARGRSILGRRASDLLTRELPAIVIHAMSWKSIEESAAYTHVECVENQESIRNELKERNLISFVANDSILPRESGVSDRPMAASSAFRFLSPKELEFSFDVPNEITWHGHRTKTIHGMGIRCGVTVLTGGGFHGKSTLLQAISNGIYPHVPGDGREYVVSDAACVKIRAEDGRRVEKVDISGFITDLPYGRQTDAFSSDNASGSTSQAANIVEAIEVGAKCLLLDEDTCATNFMVRDARMQMLISKSMEPITPYVDRVRELYDSFNISTILVVGGNSDYFEHADSILLMKEYYPLEVTEHAKKIVSDHPYGRSIEARTSFSFTPRIPSPHVMGLYEGKKGVRARGRGTDALSLAHENVDLRAIEHVVDPSQTKAIAQLLVLMFRKRIADGHATVKECVEKVNSLLDERDLDVLHPFGAFGEHPGDFARPRKFEIAAALNRLLKLDVEQSR